VLRRSLEVIDDSAGVRGRPIEVFIRKSLDQVGLPDLAKIYEDEQDSVYRMGDHLIGEFGEAEEASGGEDSERKLVRAKLRCAMASGKSRTGSRH
jgi:hypothetical protein